MNRREFWNSFPFGELGSVVIIVILVIVILAGAPMTHGMTITIDRAKLWDLILTPHFGDTRPLLPDNDCGYECEMHPVYGWVPEADCPLHDSAEPPIGILHA